MLSPMEILVLSTMDPAARAKATAALIFQHLCASGRSAASSVPDISQIAKEVGIEKVELARAIMEVPRTAWEAHAEQALIKRNTIKAFGMRTSL